ncbi:MAG: hypothetical protein R3C26_07960 [Calditrichia bacterium]
MAPEPPLSHLHSPVLLMLSAAGRSGGAVEPNASASAPCNSSR